MQHLAFGEEITINNSSSLRHHLAMFVYDDHPSIEAEQLTLLYTCANTLCFIFYATAKTEQ